MLLENGDDYGGKIEKSKLAKIEIGNERKDVIFTG